MRSIITLLILAFAQLFFNVASASPQASVKASLHKVEKKSAREDERRKRRTVKTSAKKSRSSAVQKSSKTLKTSKNATHAVTSHKTLTKTAHSSKTLAKKVAANAASKKRYGHQRAVKVAKADSKETGTIKMSNAHRQRYQKARETAMAKLMGQLGKRYQWGGKSPHTGFDCSGLVWYAYKDVVKFKIPRTANEMYHLRDAAPVNREALEKGDLVFFRINGRGTADHVGVYLGNGKFIQSPRTGKDIQISALSEDYWQRHYIGARRVMTPKTVR